MNKKAKEVNLLVLDDEENILSALKRLFREESYDIATTTSAKQAMEIIGKEKIKVVVSDQRMPEISGVDFLRNLKERFPGIVRILLTGYTDFATVEEAINLSEAYRFITKPWNANELKAVVRQAIEHFDLIEENRNLFEATKAKKEELEVANRKLKAMYELQKEFTSTVSHELRTPLASIKTAVDILISGTPGKVSADQKKILLKAENNVDRLNKLINGILDFSKLESGKMEFDIKKHNINEIIQEAAELHEPMAKENGLTIETKPDENIEEIFLDRDKILQVLSNLMDNAVKFTEKGKIVISSAAYKDQNHIRVCVEDTGAGIKQEDLPKIFEKFQQLGDPLRRKTGGVGLGLSICKEIITRHGGKIGAESTLGKGSCFYFTLPIEERRRAVHG